MGTIPIFVNNPTFKPMVRNAIPLRVQNLLRTVPQLRGNNRDELGFISSSMPTFSSTASSPGKFETIFNGALSIGSQIISAIGKNPTTQISQNNGNVQALPTPYGSAGQTSMQNQALQNQTLQPGGVGSQALNTTTSFFDGIAASFGISPTMFFVIGGIGLYLLLRPSPINRR